MAQDELLQFLDQYTSTSTTEKVSDHVESTGGVSQKKPTTDPLLENFKGKRRKSSIKSTNDPNVSDNEQTLLESQLESLRDAYEVFDEDGNGGITKEELASVMRAMGVSMTKSELEKAFKEADHDMSGTIEFNEFVHIMGNFRNGGNGISKEHGKNHRDEIDWKIAFQLFDSNDDGYIETTDLSRVLSNMGIDVPGYELMEMIATVDSTGTNKLCLDDFVSVMRDGVQFEDSEKAQ